MSDRPIVDLPIPGLDQLLIPRGILLVDKGAERPTTSVAVLGDPGAGKTTLAVAIAHAVARELDGVALYITTELASTELAYKVAFLGLERVQVLQLESAVDARAGDILAQHLALVDSEPSSASGAEARALQAALNITEADTAALPTCCVVIDAFPFPAFSSELGRHRDEVVGLVQTLEGRGVSVIIVQEAGGTNDYLPFVADLVLEARFEREIGTGEFARKVACRKSRYTRSLPGPHDSGIDFGRPAIWPNPLAVLLEERTQLGTELGAQIVSAPLFIPNPAPESVALVGPGTLLVSPFEHRSPVPGLLGHTPGIQLGSVRCGAITHIAMPGDARASVPEWEGAYSLGWTLLRLCRESHCNALVIMGLEALLHHPRFERRINNVLEALRLQGVTVCVHGEDADLGAIKALADYVWMGKQRSWTLRPSRPTYRGAAEWLCLASWPVTEAEAQVKTERDRDIRAALRRLGEVAGSGQASQAKAVLDSIQDLIADGPVSVATAQVALAHDVLGLAKTAEERLPGDSDDPAVVSSAAWAAAAMGQTWRAARYLVGQLPAKEWADSASLLWAGLVCLHAGNDEGLAQLQSSVTTRPAVVPLLLRALAARKRWEEVDAVAEAACERNRLASFFAVRMRAEARIESEDEHIRTEAEQRLTELTQGQELPPLHSADVWFNLGVLRSARGYQDGAVECWGRALELNPFLEAAKERLEAKRE
jgi:KaiC/GvpD/RAD55 family RecA-like ATPase